MSNRRTTARIAIVVSDNGGFQIVGRNAHSATQHIHSAGTAANFADRELKGVGQTSSNTTKEFSKMSQGIGGLVHTYAIFAANLFAVTAAFRALSEAANYKRMIDASSELAVKTGNNFAAVAKGMKQVSAGALDMKTAMQTANLGISAGFTGAQMKELTKLATQAGVALGRSIPDAIKRLTTAVIKGEPELTDELGIILRLKEATEDYAKAKGKAASELSTGERLQAVYQQAIERGQPKYGEIDVKEQSFEKLASSLSDISKSLLNMVNSFLNPFISKLAESKWIILGIIALLAKSLFTKASDTFSVGLNERLASAKDKLAELNRETSVLIAKLDSLKEIKSFDEQDSLRDRMKVSKRTLGEALGDADLGSLSDNIEDTLTKSFKSGGIKFVNSISDKLRRQLPKAIDQGLAKGATDVSYTDLAGKYQTLKFSSTEKLESFKKSLEEINEIEESVHRLNSTVGKAGVAAEIAATKYKKFANSMSGARIAGFSSALEKGTLDRKESLKELMENMEGASDASKGLAKGIFNISYAATKAGKFLNGMVSIFSKFAMWAAVIGIAWTAFKSVFNLDTGNLVKANELLEDINETLESASEAALTVNLNVDSLTEYKSALKKIVNIATTYTDVINDIGESLFNLQKSSWYEKAKDGGSIIEDSGKKMIKTWGKFYTLMNKTPEGADALKGIIDEMDKSTVGVKKHVENVGERLVQLYAEIQGRQDILNEAANNPDVAANIDVKAIQAKIDYRKQEVVLLQQAAHNGTIAADIEFKSVKIMQAKKDLLKAILAGNQELAEAQLTIIQKEGERLGISDTILQIMKDMGVEMQNGVLVLADWTSELKTMASILEGVMKSFASFAGSKNAQYISELEVGILKSTAEKEKAIAGNNKEMAASHQRDIDYAKEQKSLIRKNAAFTRAQAAQTFQTSRTYVDNLQRKQKEGSTITQKEITGAIEKNNKKFLENANDQTKAQLALNNAKREEQKYDTATTLVEKEKLHIAKGQVTAAQRNLDIKQEEGRLILKDREALGGVGPQTKAKAAGGSKTAKVTKVEGREAQIALEKLKQIQTIYSNIQKAEGSSMKERYEASKQLYAMELAMHDLRLGVIEGNKKDAQTNIDAALAKGDNEKLLQAQLAMQKAVTAEVAERAGHYERTYQIAKKTHEDQKNMFKEDFPDLKMFSAVLYKDIQKAAKDLRDALMDPISLITEALVDVFKTGSDSIADAIVENDWSSVNENIAESLKGSAKKMISTGIQGILSSFIPVGHLGAGTDTDQLSAQNTTNKILNDILIEQKKESIMGMFSGGSSGSISFMEQGFYALLNLFKFEKGGIIDHLGIGQYASGHIATRPELAMIGEGKMNEAVIPMPDNKSVPVTLSGATGSTNSNVYVNIASDGTAQTSTESDSQEAKRLGELINKSVQRIIVEERRVGGLLGA